MISGSGVLFFWCPYERTRKMSVSAYCFFLSLELCNGVDVSWFLLSHLIRLVSWCFASQGLQQQTGGPREQWRVTTCWAGKATYRQRSDRYETLNPAKVNIPRDFDSQTSKTNSKQETLETCLQNKGAKGFPKRHHVPVPISRLLQRSCHMISPATWPA